MDEHDKKIPITGTGTYRILSHKTEMVNFPLTKKRKKRENKNRKTRKKERKKMSESKVSKRKQTASNIENRV